MNSHADRFLFWGVFWALIVFGVLAITGRADAQVPPPTCLPFAALSKDLETRFKEVELSGGIVSENEVVIIFGTPTGTSWTMVSVTMDTGIACIRGSGQHWFQIPLMSGQPV
jgi:hypothetical protein